MSATVQHEAAGSAPLSVVSAVGNVLVYVGFAAMAVSAVWTAAPGGPERPYEWYTIDRLGLALIAVGAIGGSRFAGSTAGKLLCALGAALCLRVAGEPLLEQVPGLQAVMPQWLADAYPGLATVGWMVAGLGALIWWLGGARAPGASPYAGIAVACGLVLVGATVLVWVGLVAAGYADRVPAHENGLLIWQLVQMTAILVIAMSVSGGRRFGQWPVILFGAALVGHAVRLFVGQASG